MDHKKRIQGEVVSATNDKTIKIQTISYKKHPLYKKRVETRSTYYAHDEENAANVGDTVTVETQMGELTYKVLEIQRAEEN